MDKSTLIA